MKILLALLASLILSVSAMADGLSVEAGKLINNINHDHPGYTIGRSYTKGPFQFSVDKVNNTYMGAEMIASAMYRFQYRNASLAVGPIVSYSVQVDDWWWKDGHNGTNEAWGLRANCLFCGSQAQLAYKFNDRLELQVRYMATEKFIIPSHNGAMVLMSYQL